MTKRFIFDKVVCNDTNNTKGGFCDMMRNFHGCSMDAKYFEAKEK